MRESSAGKEGERGKKRRQKAKCDGGNFKREGEENADAPEVFGEHEEQEARPYF